VNWELTLSKPAFVELLTRLESNANRISVCPTGLSKLPERTIVLAHSLDLSTPAARKQEARLVVTGAETAERCISGCTRS
jgi:hypothetical protein